MSAVPVPDHAARLDQLAEEVAGHHAWVRKAGKRMVAEAIAAGDALLETKDLVRHGEFGPYVERCGVEPRLAQYYMTVAKAKAKRFVFDAPSLNAALRALAKEREETDGVNADLRDALTKRKRRRRVIAPLEIRPARELIDLIYDVESGIRDFGELVALARDLDDEIPDLGDLPQLSEDGHVDENAEDATSV